MNSYFEAQSGFYGQTPGAPGGDYRFPIGLGGLSSMSPYGQHQPRPPQTDTSYDTPSSPSKASSLYSSLTDSASYSSKIDCKDQNGYGASIKPDIGAGPVSAMTAGWGGSPGSARGSKLSAEDNAVRMQKVERRKSRSWFSKNSPEKILRIFCFPPLQSRLGEGWAITSPRSLTKVSLISTFIS